MPFSNSQLAALLYFFLGLTLPVAMYFMPDSDYVVVLLIGYMAFCGLIYLALMA